MMSRKVMFVVFLVFGLGSVALSQQQTYTLKGKIDGLTDGTILELTPYTHDQESPDNSTTVKNSEFTFTGSLESPRYYKLHVRGEDRGIFLMVGDGDVIISGTARAMINRESKFHVFSDIKIESNAHDEFLAKTKPRRELNELHRKHAEESSAMAQKVIEARASDPAVLKALEETEEYKNYAKGDEELFNMVAQVLAKMVLDNKDSWWGPFLMIQQYQWLEEKDKAIYEQFSPAAKESYYGQKVHAELYPESRMGMPAPALDFTNEQGNDVSFASLANGKKYIVLDFWASWCGPCRKAFPALREFYEKHKNDVEIISISIDEDKGEWIKACNEENLPWPSFLDYKKIFDAYGAKFIPAMFLLDIDGNFVADDVTMENLESKIK